jgi:hypothetical protein
MNREEIIRMAREAGIGETGLWFSCVEEELVRFANLVAAAELRRLHEVEQALALWIEKTDWVQRTAEPSELGLHRADVLKSRIERAAAYEREACAQIAAAGGHDIYITTAIRKRGKNE